jgi:hypothetical protein
MQDEPNLKEIIDYLSSQEFDCDPYMSNKDKNILKKRILEMQTFSEIARQNNVTPARIGDRFHKIFPRLKILLQNETLDAKIVDCRLFLPGKAMRNPYSLEQLGIIYIRDLHGFPASKIKNSRNWGIVSVRRLNDYIKRFGICLQNDLD